MTPSVANGRVVDLRVEPIDEVLDRVARTLQVRLDTDTVVRKRRSVGARTSRETWVRVERRPLHKVLGQGWNGTECAETLTGIAKPYWRQSVSWRDSVDAALWRADETTLLPGTPVSTSVLSADPRLPDAWWKELGTTLDSLGRQRTRIATPDTEPITQSLVTETIRTAFPGRADAAVRQWLPAHADLNWANVTGPCFCLFDWEDWGNAPRGLDAASLLAASMAVPALAERVRRERHHDLESRDGKVMKLFVFAKFAEPDAHPEDPRVEPARQEAARLLTELQTT
ncbi:MULTISPECIES: hypothetical protein [unclassified Kitasatospora]|uniref:hypothetical protein n=1 Tax=unclassified Kitasatospora TaxID=2633591 RepID=UPI003817B0D5